MASKSGASSRREHEAHKRITSNSMLEKPSMALPGPSPKMFSQVIEIEQEDISYGDHALQTASVYRRRFPEKSHGQSPGKAIWIIYIHGGAWRDPAVTHNSFIPTIRNLFKHYAKLIDMSVPYFASISYRLSFHSQHPQNPETPEYECNVAKHPQHIQDVVACISTLQRIYGFGSKYMLVGHSCGATLAFQTIMRSQFFDPRSFPMKNPEMIVGVAGIYDLQLLRKNNTHPIYQDFLVSAFGENEMDWDNASPACYDLATFPWPEVKAVILASSSGDVLVDAAQIQHMGIQLGNMRQKTTVTVMEDFLDQTHNAIWEEGSGLADVIVESLRTWLHID